MRSRAGVWGGGGPGSERVAPKGTFGQTQILEQLMHTIGVESERPDVLQIQMAAYMGQAYLESGRPADARSTSMRIRASTLRASARCL